MRHEEDVLGFIDWNGTFHKCSYGEHSILAMKLAKELLKKDDYKSEQRIHYGLVKISNSSMCECYYVYLPKVLNDKQIVTLEKLSEDKETNPHLSYAIKYTLKKYNSNQDIISELLDVMEEPVISCSMDEYDFGITGSSVGFKYKKDWSRVE